MLGWASVICVFSTQCLKSTNYSSDLYNNNWPESKEARAADRGQSTGEASKSSRHWISVGLVVTTASLQ